MKNFLTNFFKEEEGQGMAEYALVLGVIAVGVIGVLILFGEEIIIKFEEVTEKLKNAGKTETP